MDTQYKRPSWDEYFMEIAQVVGKRSTCDRGKRGCVITRDKQILVTGYAGSPKGLPHCDDMGHLFNETTHEDGSKTQHCVRTTHAEQNAIAQAAKLGIAINEGTLYCTVTPCFICAKLLINSGIKRIVCAKKYQAAIESENMFRQVGIELSYFDESVEQYEKQ